MRPESPQRAVCGLDGRPENQPSSTSELADVLAFAAASGVCRRDVAMLGAATLGGWSAGQVAAQFDVTTRTVRNRRRRTTKALEALMAA